MNKTSVQTTGPQLSEVLRSLAGSHQLLLKKVRALRLAYADSLGQGALVRPSADGWDASGSAPVDEAAAHAPQRVQWAGEASDLVAEGPKAMSPELMPSSEGYNFFDELDTKLAVMKDPATGQGLPGDRPNA